MTASGTASQGNLITSLDHPSSNIMQVIKTFRSQFKHSLAIHIAPRHAIGLTIPTPIPSPTLRYLTSAPPIQQRCDWHRIRFIPLRIPSDWNDVSILTTQTLIRTYETSLITHARSTTRRSQFHTGIFPRSMMALWMVKLYQELQI